MPIRIPVQSVKVTRDGKSVFPKLNKPFDFTAEEIEALTAANPICLRKPIVEASSAAEADVVQESETQETATASRPAKKGQKQKPADDF